MATFRDRFPPARDVASIFALCVVPIYSWCILAYLGRARSWLFHMPPWDVVGILAYSLVFSALESGAVLVVLLLLSAVLPGRILRDRFVTRGSTLAGWWLGCAALVHVGLTIQFPRLAQHHPLICLLGLLAVLVMLVICFVLAWRSERLAQTIASLAERMVLLMVPYMLATVVAAVIVVIRNL